jgi:hypothetical protein
MAFLLTNSGGGQHREPHGKWHGTLFLNCLRLKMVFLSETHILECYILVSFRDTMFTDQKRKSWGLVNAVAVAESEKEGCSRPHNKGGRRTWGGFETRPLTDQSGDPFWVLSQHHNILGWLAMVLSLHLFPWCASAFMLLKVGEPRAGNLSLLTQTGSANLCRGHSFLTPTVSYRKNSTLTFQGLIILVEQIGLEKWHYKVSFILSC